MPTIIELETLDRTIKICEAIIDQEMDAERRNFEEGCKDLDHELLDETLDEIREWEKKSNQMHHRFVQLCELEDLLPRLRLMVNTGIAGNPIARYSEYFKAQK